MNKVNMLSLLAVCTLLSHGAWVSSSPAANLDAHLELSERAENGETVALNVGHNFEATCLTKLSQESHCKANKGCEELLINWRLPLVLSAVKLKTESVRTEIQEQPIVGFANKTEVHASKIIMRNIGLIHNGRYACVIRFVNRQTGGDYIAKVIEFNVRVTGGEQGASCDHEDQCQSRSCVANVCLCNEQKPVYNSTNQECYRAIALDEECLFDAQCSARTEGPVSCACNDNSVLCEKRSCRCNDGYIRSSSAFGRQECLLPVAIDGECKTSSQCRASHSKTFCSFNNVCKCKKNQIC